MNEWLYKEIVHLAPLGGDAIHGRYRKKEHSQGIPADWIRSDWMHARKYNRYNLFRNVGSSHARALTG